MRLPPGVPVSMVGDGRHETAVGCDEVDGALEGSAEREGSFEGFELGDELGASVVEGALDGRLLGDELGALEKVPHPSSTWIWM